MLPKLLQNLMPIILAIAFVMLVIWLVVVARRRFAVAPKQIAASGIYRVMQSEHVEWTEFNLKELRKFYGSETGQKLIKICGSHITVEAMKECGGDKAAPCAYGMDSLLRFQFNLASDAMLAKISPPPAIQEEDTADTEDTGGVPVEIRRSFTS